MRFRNLLKSAGFVLGLILMFWIMSNIFGREEQEIYDICAVRKKVAEISAENQNSIDILFLGDSVCYSSFSPQYMWKKFGYSSYVCATSAQRLCDTYAILKDTYMTQTPKVVVLETNCLYRKLKNNSVTNDIVLNKLIEHSAVFAHHSDWKSGVGDIMAEVLEKKPSVSKGFIKRTGSNPYRGGSYMEATDDARTIDTNIVKYMDNIYELCKENSAVLILVSSPSPKNWNYEKHNGVLQWANDKGVSYIDMNLVPGIGIDWETDTRDKGDHLNIFGAEKVTEYMGSIFSDMSILTDKRDNSDYNEWNEYCIN